MFQQQFGGEQAVVEEEDDEIGGYLAPGGEDVLEVDMQLREHFRIEHGYQNDGCPHHEIEEIFPDRLFFA